MTYEIEKLDQRTRKIILHPNTGPFEALAYINPELAVTAYAHRSGLINGKNMPFLANLRYLQAKENIAFLEAMVEKLSIETQADTRRYEVDGTVTITKEVQRGLTIRNETSETEATKRTIRQAEAFEKAKKMDYEVSLRAIEANLEERKYLSDNQLVAVREESQARYDAIEAINQIRADTERGISRDRLEERVKVASMEFAQKMAVAQMLRDEKKDKTKVRVTKYWLESQTEIMTQMIVYQKEIGLAREKTNQEREITAQKSIDAGTRIAEAALNAGQEEVDLSINLDGKKIEINYRAPKNKR